MVGMFGIAQRRVAPDVEFTDAFEIRRTSQSAAACFDVNEAGPHRDLLSVRNTLPEGVQNNQRQIRAERRKFGLYKSVSLRSHRTAGRARPESPGFEQSRFRNLYRRRILSRGARRFLAVQSVTNDFGR